MRTGKIRKTFVHRWTSPSVVPESLSHNLQQNNRRTRSSPIENRTQSCVLLYCSGRSVVKISSVAVYRHLNALMTPKWCQLLQWWLLYKRRRTPRQKKFQTDGNFDKTRRQNELDDSERHSIPRKIHVFVYRPMTARCKGQYSMSAIDVKDYHWLETRPILSLWIAAKCFQATCQ